MDSAAGAGDDGCSEGRAIASPEISVATERNGIVDHAERFAQVHVGLRVSVVVVETVEIVVLVSIFFRRLDFWRRRRTKIKGLVRIFVFRESLFLGFHFLPEGIIGGLLPFP